MIIEVVYIMLFAVAFSYLHDTIDILATYSSTKIFSIVHINNKKSRYKVVILKLMDHWLCMSRDYARLVNRKRSQEDEILLFSSHQLSD